MAGEGLQHEVRAWGHHLCCDQNKRETRGEMEGEEGTEMGAGQRGKN